MTSSAKSVELDKFGASWREAWCGCGVCVMSGVGVAGYGLLFMVCEVSGVTVAGECCCEWCGVWCECVGHCVGVMSDVGLCGVDLSCVFLFVNTINSQYLWVINYGCMDKRYPMQQFTFVSCTLDINYTIANISSERQNDSILQFPYLAGLKISEKLTAVH